MAKTLSNMIELGTPAPDFRLPNVVTGQPAVLKELASDKATVIIFMCNHCPFVARIIDKISSIAKEYHAKGIQFIAISANDVDNYPQDSPEHMASYVTQYDLCFPYLYDETQEIAKAYDAACTPDFYVFDGELKCVYRGRFDAATPGNDIPATGEELCAALDAVLEGQTVNPEQHPSIGCNIKWKPEDTAADLTNAVIKEEDLS